MAGSWGRYLNRLVRKLNRLYFDTTGALKSLVQDKASLKEMENLLLHFFAYASKSKQHFNNCIQFAQSKGVLRRCRSQIRTMRDNLRYYNDRISLVSTYCDALNGAGRSVVAGNIQNVLYREFVRYAAINSQLSFQALVENAARAEQIFIEQQYAFPKSLTTQQMHTELTQLYHHIGNLFLQNGELCSAAAPLSEHPHAINPEGACEPGRTSTQQIPGAPPLNIPLPHPNIDTPDIKLPDHTCGNSATPDLPKDLGPDNINPGDTIKPRPCNYSQMSDTPQLEVTPQVTDQTPQPDPDHNGAGILPEQIPQVQAIPVTTDAESESSAEAVDSATDQAQASVEGGGTSKKQKQNKSYDERIVEILANLARKIQALELQRQTELATTSIPEERLAIGQRIQCAIEIEQVKSAQTVAKITNAKIKNEQQKTQERLNKEQATQGLTIDNLPVIKPEDLHDSLGDLELVCELIKEFKNYIGALNTDGPITRIVTKGLKSCNDGQVSRAIGALKELLVARMSKREIIRAFDRVIKILEEIHNNLGLDMTRKSIEFDIETELSFIEVKGGQWKEFNLIDVIGNINLDYLSSLTSDGFKNFIKSLNETSTNKDILKDIYDTLKKFLIQREVAKSMNKNFVLVYFNELPPCLKLWLEKENINFIKYTNNERLSR